MPNIRLAIGISILFYVFYFAAKICYHFLEMTGLNLDATTEFLTEQVIAWLCTLMIAKRVAKANWSDCYPLKAVNGQTYIPLVLASIGAFVVLTEISGLIPMPEWLREGLEKFTSNKIASFFALIIVAPVAEEYYFRGWMLRGFLANYTTRKAVIVSATLFAIFHLNPWQAISAFPLGIVYAWLVIKTGSLIPSIVSHMVVNSSGFLIELLLTKLGYSEEMIHEMAFLPWQVVVGGVALLIMGGWWLYSKVSDESVLDTRTTT